VTSASDAYAEELRRRRGWLDSAECGGLDDAALYERFSGVRVVLLRRDRSPGGEVARRFALLAAAARTPVVAVRGPGIADVVRHARDGYVTDDDDENHLRAAVAKLLRDDVVWTRLRAALERTPPKTG
jgi:glycosyltransferase involved in cell wall biosynthesis